MAMLLRAKEISRPADFQITHGNFKASSQFRKFLNGLKSLLCHLRQHLILLVQEISVSNIT